MIVWLPFLWSAQACGLACTSVGCESSLELTFNRALSEDAVLTVDSGGVPWVVDCAQQSCGTQLHFVGLIIGHAQVRVVEGDVETVYDINPQYQESHPNGPDCEPTCHVAEVSLILP